MRTLVARFAIDRPVTVIMVMTAALVVGMLAYLRIPMQMLPDGIDPKFLWVRVPYGNASPREVDSLVVAPIEGELGTLSGLKTLTSRASSGFAGFEVEFHPSVSMDAAYNDVVDRMERALPSLPDDVERYFVFRFNPADQPILWLGVTWPDDMDDPYAVITDVVVPAVERVDGVASVDVWGVPSRRVFVDYDRARIVSHGVDLGDVQRRLGNDNFQLAGGRMVDRGEVRLVRSLARVEELDTLRRYPVRQDGLVLGDFAEVSLRGVASADINRIEGREGGVLVVRKESSANAVSTTRAVHAAIAAVQQDPRAKGVAAAVFFDQGEIIADSVDTLQTAALTGGLLSVVILWIFLREIRMTLIVSTAIPASLLVTIGVLYMRGDSLNLIAMMGLLLAVGMVVDNAIVVVESIFRRRAEGQAPREAAIDGAGEVGLAILASTATTMVVFLPVMLMTEDADASFFLGVLGTPVIVALGASLVVALGVAPLVTRALPASEAPPPPGWLLWLEGVYSRVLGRALAHRFDSGAMLLGALLLTGAIAAPGVRCTPGEGGGLNDFTIRFDVPRDSSYAERDALVRAFEDLLAANREAWGVKVYRSDLDAEDTSGRVFVYLAKDGPMPREDVIKAVEKALPTELPGANPRIGWEGGGREDRTLELSLYGEDLDEINGLVEEAVRRIRQVPGVLGAARSDAESGADELRLLPDREALTRYGVSAQTLGGTVAFAMRGRALDPVSVRGADVVLETRLRLEDRQDIATMLDFPVFSPQVAGLVPVRALTDVVRGRGPDSIRRRDRRTSVGITVDLADDVDRAAALPLVRRALEDMALPRGVSWDASGFEAAQEAENAALFFALFMSVVFVYLLMGVLFESWSLPMSILVTLPLAAMGAVWLLFLTGSNMDTMAGIGLVVLVGVVVNNGIVLVDRIVQLRAEGVAREDAVREACARRLRPILMTAVTTIAGLVPMAMGDTNFVGLPYAPLGRTVIGGLTAATFLTLVYVPLFYTWIDDLRGWASRMWAFASANREAAA